MLGKLIIFSAPSGAGKTTIVRYLISLNLNIGFSVSVTSRNKRYTETDGKDYYFITPDQFREKIQNNEFVEWQEVYNGDFYGTLKSEVERIRQEGKNVIFDVDVVGGCNLKNLYGDEALAIFVQPPSVTELRNRLYARSTDKPEVIEKRIAKAEYELKFAGKFDAVIVNENLEIAFSEAEKIVTDFISKA